MHGHMNVKFSIRITSVRFLLIWIGLQMVYSVMQCEDSTKVFSPPSQKVSFIVLV